MGAPISGSNNLGLDDLGGDDSSPIDVSDFAPKPISKKQKTPKRDIRAASHDAGFHDRGEPTVPAEKGEGRDAATSTRPRAKTAAAPSKSTSETGGMRRSQFYRTGRSTQLNVKVRAEDRKRLKELCERHEWVAGQALGYALDALEEKIGNKDDQFWIERFYRGVE